MSTASIRQTILRILDEVRPHALPQAQLLAEVNRLVRPAVERVDLSEQLSWLRGEQLVSHLPDPLAPDNRNEWRWLITEAGRTALRQ